MPKTVRLNFTVPESVAQDLKKRVNKSKRSAFVAEALKERLEELEKLQLAQELKEGYLARCEENSEVNDEWEIATLETWQ